MTGSVVTALADSLYQAQPQRILYHYTSISSMIGIVSSNCLWASEIRYLNDAMELKHLHQLVTNLVRAVDGQADVSAEIVRQFGNWLSERVQHGPLVFLVSLTEMGNLLSQWRGYTPHGQGVSLGFEPQDLIQVANRASFKFGRCLYDPKEHNNIVNNLLNEIVAEAQSRGPSSDAHPSQCYHPYFSEIEEDVLRICALLKHPSFAEENEWRAVSQAHSKYVVPEIKYRTGGSFLVPYIELPLSTPERGLTIPHVIVGPTPTPDLSLSSISMFLSKHAPTTEMRTVQNCSIPYRG